MKHYFLGLAAGRKGALRQLFTRGSRRDEAELTDYLAEKYHGQAILMKNGRSALTMALRTYFNYGDSVIVNAFTCYAVYEAVEAAGLVPVFQDISREDLNFDLKHWSAEAKRARGIIVQNTLGNPIDMQTVEKLAAKNGWLIIEDLAHSVGAKYPDGREVGTVGAATVLSFGKDKAIDATSGGAVVLRQVFSKLVKVPYRPPRPSDYLRERWYPAFAAVVRGLSRVHLGGVLMRFLVKIHFVERSADNRLDLDQKMPKFEAKLALRQLKNLKPRTPLREFYLVRDRAECLQRLRKAGYHFDGFWYERPVSPERYYEAVNFDEAACPVAVEISEKILNLPTYYGRQELSDARKIIKEYADE